MNSPNDFHQTLLAAFPPEPFHGPVSDHGECDDGQFLRTHLPGKCWDELTPEYLSHASIALPLLLPDALRAFLPAWLLHAARSTSTDDLATDFTIYFLCPGNPEEGWRHELVAQRAALFTPLQREAVAALLRLILQRPDRRHLHPYAQFALHHWNA